MAGSSLAAEFVLLKHLRGLRLMALLLAALAVVATLSGVLREGDRSRALDELTGAEEELRSTLAASLERAASGPAPVATKPGALGFSVLSEYVAIERPAASVLASGVTDLKPDYFRFDAHAAYLQARGGDIDNPLRLAVGSFDLAFVLVFVVPIVVIALSYDAVSSAKESGVLALACAQGVGLRRYIVGKLVARAIAIGAIVVAMVLAAVVIAALFTEWPAWQTIGMLIGLSLAYALVWFALAALVNAFDLTSATNGVLLANVWLLLVVIVPAVVALAATSLFPAPSRVALTTELREAAAEAEEQASAAREQYLFDHPDLAAADVDQEIFFRAVADSEAQIAASIEPELAAFDRQAERQAAIVSRLAVATPALTLREALLRLVGTDRDYYAAFRRSAFEHHARWRGFFVERLANADELDGADWAALPAFEWDSPGAAERAARALPALVLLTGAALALWWLALRRYRRYRPI